MDIYSKAEAELNSIDQQIAALQRRQVELRQFVSLGRKLFDSQPMQRTLQLPERNAMQEIGIAALAKVSRPRGGSMKARVLEISEEIISLVGPMPTKDLVKALEERGVTITGADKAVTVGVILSRSEKFKADRTQGWTIVEAKENPQDVGASAGSHAA